MCMNDKKKYKISLLGEFIDKSIESEYLIDSLRSSSKITSYTALVIGFIMMLFLVNGYIVDDRTPYFLNIILIRMLVVIISVIIFTVAKKIKEYRNFIYLITFYQAVMVVYYIFVLTQYNPLNYFSVLGLMVITLAIYILPNKIIISQIISIILSILFFIYPIKKIEGLEEYEFYKIIVYQIILLIYCNVNIYWTEFNKRKKFAANSELMDLSVKDPLTGIYNRLKFDDDINKWINLSERYGNPFSIILFDIDDFKEINDKYGHLAGDSVAIKIVETISKTIRDTDIFARWGGDEFVLLLPNTDVQEAENMAERMRDCISNNLCDPIRNITCSFGVAAYEKNDTIQSLLNKADKLLLQAKASGKDRVVSMDSCTAQN
jgi:two-component system cell cycle response regulator